MALTYGRPSSAARVIGCNCSKVFANAVVAVDGMMAGRAERNQIARMVVSLILVDMVYMQLVSPALALLTTKLARPIVAIFGLPAEAFPVRRIIPVCNASFPGSIVGSAGRAANSKGFGGCSAWDAMPAKGLGNRGRIDRKLIGYFLQCATLANVFLAQPIRIMIGLLWSVMAKCILPPMTVFAYPFDRVTTSASATRGLAVWLVDWLAGAMLAGFRLRPTFVFVFFQKIPYVCWRALKTFRYFLVRRIVARSRPHPVVITDRQFFVFRE